MHAVDADLRHERPLGNPATTDASGAYRIPYVQAQLGSGEIAADLIVRAFTVAPPGAMPKLLAESPTIFNAPQDATVDLVIGGDTYLGPSEYERLVAGLLPALDGVLPEDLTVGDVSWLVQETGFAYEWIASYAYGSFLAKQTGISVEVFYGLLRESIPFRGLGVFSRPSSELAAALNDAIAKNIIRTYDDAWVQNAVNQLQQQGVKALLGTDPSALGALFTAAGVPLPAQQAFAQAYLGAPATTDELWSNLTTSIGAAAVKQLQTAFQWGAVTFNHPPLVAVLVKALKQPSDVAGLTLANWRTYIDQVGAAGQPAVPDRIQAATEDERRSFYAQQLYAFAHDTFSATALSTQLQGSTLSTAPAAQAFLTAHPEWNLDLVPARAFLAANTVDAQTGAALGQLQRVHRVTQQANWSVKLLENQITSAQAIARTSVDRLAQVTGAAAAEAAAMRDRAHAIVDAGAAIHARFSARYNLPSLPAVPRMEQVTVEAEQYQDVFGPAPLCACEECGSVLGAAAYLVDLFQFLVKWSQPAWTELFARRPDLKDLELSCANTLTPLPLIDLANEVLEAVALGQPPAAQQTTWSAPDLAANPEHLNSAAYTPLAAATFPWTLPFDLALSEARVYLEHLGVSRYDLMLTLASATAPDETTLATELLGMTSAEWSTIANRAAVATDGTADPNWGGKSPSQLRSVKLFLAQSGLGAAELPPLLNTRFVNPESVPRNARIGIEMNNALCNPESAEFINLHGDGIDRIRRFVRLERRLGWTFAELDAVIAALAGGVLDGPGLQRIARLERIRRATQLSVMEQLAWWAPLDTYPGADGRSQYDDVYVSRAGISIGTLPDNASAPDPLALNATTKQPNGAAAGVAIRTFLPRIIAALHLTADEVEALLTPEVATGSGLDLALSVDSLSALYRALSLTRAAALSPADYGRLRRLSALRPFANDLDSARLFLDVARAATSSPLPLAEWAFALRDEPIDTFAFADADATVFLTELRTALQSIDADRTAAENDPDPVGVVRRKLARLVSGADLVAAIAFLDEAPGTSLAALPKPLDALGLPSAAVTSLETATPNTPANVLARYALVRTPLLDRLDLLDKTSLIINRLAAAAATSVSLANALARDPFGPPAGRALLTVLLEAPVVDDTVVIARATAALQPAYAGLRLFGKQALVAGRLGIVKDELITIQSGQATLGWLDWTRFPAKAGDPPLAWEGVAGLVQYVALRKSVAHGRAPLWELFALAAQAAPAAVTAADWRNRFLAELARRTGWEDVASDAAEAPNLDALADALGFNQRSAFQTIDAYVKLAAAVALAKRMGLPGKTIGGAATNWRIDVTPSLSADIKGAARSKHAAGDWLSIAKALRDPLREQQRDALLGYVVGNRALYADANVAFDKLLIDVQMSACCLTSRIKQAVGSTQLFIERCLLGSEGDPLRLPPEAAWQWKWMRDYRVWEANRQIFLYPENWLQPELRSDKTKFFQELEDELHQKAITSQNAEDALHHYLEKLDSVAKLEIVGFVTQAGAFNSLSNDPKEDTTAVHVIGRSQGAPSIYYYRRLERGWHWTPWEQINIDITGDHVMPFIWHRRLFLFWLQFHEKSDPSAQKSPDISGPNNEIKPTALPSPTKHLEIKVAWSERKSDRWLPRRMSNDVLIADPADASLLPLFNTHAYVDGTAAGALHVQVVLNQFFVSHDT
ncbi:MAG TPA: neuraminidase-like domain-containing protein, partial [Polyangia bacterium]|nr:neuraminidase-like domain-containing protein [Polyangia bacterium]